MVYKPRQNILHWIIVLLMMTNAIPSFAIQNNIPKPKDTLATKLATAKAVVGKANAGTKKLSSPQQVRKLLNTTNKNLAPIKKNLADRKKAITAKTLNSYQSSLKKSHDQLGAYKQVLGKNQSALKKAANQLATVQKDSVLTISSKDSAVNPAFAAQLLLMKNRLLQANRSVNSALDTTNKYLLQVTTAYLAVANLQENINERLNKPATSELHQETSYIWSAPKETTKTNIASNLSDTYAWQDKILNEFVDRSWDDRLLALLLGGLFFIWVFFDYKKAKQPEQQKNIGELNFKHIGAVPVLGSIIVTLVLLPLCQPDAPFQYMEIVHLLLLVTLCVFFWKRLQKSELRYWFFMVLLFIVIELTTAAVHDSLFLRLWFIFLNLSSIYFGYVFSRKLLQAEVAKSLIKPVLGIYLTLNLLAVVTNIFGRMSLAKAFTGTAIIGITEVIGLAVFIQLLTDALELQIKLSACGGGLFSRLDIPSTRVSFKKLLAGVAIIIWLLVFMINLGVSKDVWDFISQLLNDQRVFGSINFRIGNVLFFALILYLSNIFQKHIGVLFGEKSITFNNQVEHGSSKLTLLRLIVAIVGVLFAITASGIPLDKLTVVLGALSVGIGLGMQNIVNNFVSGVILIFEKPFQIGDFVELADKKGKIHDIGIRASKMLTQQGSEVIIPNGDLISNRFTNWTINSAYVKSEILIKISINADLEAVKKIIAEEIKSAEETVKDYEPEILINSIGSDAMELRILMWISNIYAEPTYKSKILTGLIPKFNTAQIKLM